MPATSCGSCSGVPGAYLPGKGDTEWVVVVTVHVGVCINDLVRLKVLEISGAELTPRAAVVAAVTWSTPG